MTTPAERTEAVTETTKSRLEEAHKFAINYGADRGYYYEFQGDDIANLIARIRREATNAALEEAAKKCEQRANSLRDGVAIANLCARDVRSIKDQQ